MEKIDRESVKTLAIAVGVRQAARETGIPENTVLSWSKRDNWFTDPPKPITVEQQNGRAIAAITPSLALQNTLSQRKDKTKLNLSKYVLNGSKVAAKSRSPLQDAGKVKDLATVMEKVWPEQQQTSSNLDLRILAGGRAMIQVNQASPQP